MKFAGLAHLSREKKQFQGELHTALYSKIKYTTYNRKYNFFFGGGEGEGSQAVLEQGFHFADFWMVMSWAGFRAGPDIPIAPTSGSPDSSGFWGRAFLSNESESMPQSLLEGF